MNKIKGLLLVGGVMLLGASSCTLSHTAVVTNNPVGSKKGVAKASNFNSKNEVTYQKAMEKGKIEKVGIAEYKVTGFLIFTNRTLTVTGE
jgi:hypothetical protein